MKGTKRLALLLPDMRGGGAERVALELAREWVRAGHQVDLVLLQATGALLPLVPGEVRIVDLGARRIRGALLPLIRYLRRERPDGVQASMWPITILAILAHKLARSEARLVVSEHVGLSDQHKESAWWNRQLLRASVRLFYPLADARVAVSDGAADDMAAYCGIRRGSISSIYNPISATSPHQIAADIAAWGDAQFRILSVGALKDQKNHALLIRAFNHVVALCDAKLIIVGTGPLEDALEQLIESLGLNGRVELVGFALDPSPYYAAAHLFVLSSDYEGFGNVLVEAMSFGVPVVSTDCRSGPREILCDGELGSLVPTGDELGLANAIIATLRSPPSPQRLIARAADFSSRRAALRYLELLGIPAAPDDLRTEQP